MSVLFHPAAGPIKLGYLSPHNPYDRRAFSGTSFFAARALAAHPGIRLRILGAHRAPGRFGSRLDRLRRKPAPRIRLDRNETEGLDAVLGLAATPLMEALARQRPELPLLHVTDATPRFLRDVYGWDVPRLADHREAALVAHATATIYSSPEMAARAPGDLGLPGLKPLSQPFGINLETLPRFCPEKPAPRPLKLLFVGLDWVRKGGDIAVRVVDELAAMGVEVQLTLVGKPPKRLKSHPAIQIAGFLDKNRPRDALKLSQLYTEAHLLILPSRADCTPMVVAEAMAHGTPVVGSETGGLASLLGGSGAGAMLAPEAAPRAWAEMVDELTANPELYAMLSETAFDRATTGLNWRHWAEAVHGVALDVRQQALIRAGAA